LQYILRVFLADSIILQFLTVAFYILLHLKWVTFAMSFKH